MRELIPYCQDVMRILTEIDDEAEATSVITERDNQCGGLSLAIRYRGGSTLHAELWVNCSGEAPRWDDYAFHYQDRTNALRFRYDNAPHHQELPNFPHHLHLADGRVRPLGPPGLRPLAQAVRRHLQYPGAPREPEQP